MERCRKENPLTICATLALVLASGQTAAAVTQSQLNAFKIMNYYPSVNNWSAMWTNWNATQINSDFALIASMHGNVVRVIIQANTFGYPNPTSTMLGELSSMISMANSNGLKVQLTLFDLWSSYTDISGSKTWANAVVSPYASDSRIAFIELRNEIDTTDSSQMSWAQTMIPYLRTVAGNTPITVSVTGDLTVTLPALISKLGSDQPDFYDVHNYYYSPDEAYYQISQAKTAATNLGGRPLLVGETGHTTNAAGFTSGFASFPQVQASYEAYQQYFYRLEFEATEGLGLPPAAPWILWDFTSCPSCGSDPSELNFGLYRTDGTAKPAQGTVSSVFQGNGVGGFNAGFEAYNNDPVSGRNQPQLWVGDTPSSATYEDDTSTSHTGCCSAKISNTTGNPGFFISPVANINPSTGSHTATVWVKLSAATGTTQICLVWYTSARASSTTACSASVSGTSGWQQLSVSSTPPSNTAEGRIYLRSGNNTGSAWFDDVTFQ